MADWEPSEEEIADEMKAINSGHMMPDVYLLARYVLKRVHAAEVAAREEAAKACDDIADKNACYPVVRRVGARDCAKAVRALNGERRDGR